MAFSLKNSKMYVINLDRDEEAMLLSKKQFQHHGIDVERFSAIDGNKCLIPDKCQISGVDIKNVRSPGEYGCSMSHISVLKKALEDGVDYAIVFEDDVVLCDDFLSRLKYLERCQVEFDLFYLGGNFGSWHTFTQTENKYIYRYTGAAGAWGYIASKTIFDFVEKNYRFDLAIDGFYSKCLAGENDTLRRFEHCPKFDVKGFLPLAVSARSRASSTNRFGHFHKVDDSKFQKAPLQLTDLV